MRRSFFALLAKSLAFFVTPVLILGILGYASVFISRRYAAEQVAQLAATTLYQIERVSQQLIREARATAIAFGTAAPVLQALRARLGDEDVDLAALRELELIRNLVSTSAHARDHLRSIYIYLEDFDAVLTTDYGTRSLEAMSDRSWLQQYRAQSPRMITWAARRDYQVLSARVAAESVISVYQRFYTFATEGLEGVVVLNVREDAILDLIEEASLSRRQRSAVFDEAGRLITTNVEDEQAVDLLRETPITRAQPTRFGGDDYVISSSLSAETGWKYVMMTPRSLFYAPVIGMVRISAAIVTIAVVLGLVIVAILARRSYGFIREIVDVIERSESGQSLPSFQDHPTSGFGYITYHVLRAFVERQYYQLQLSERAYREKTLELLALQSQMNPHFLFNTLEAVNWQILSETGTPGPANEMIESLAQIMKYALRPPTRLVPLAAELENVRNYVRIQSLRQQSEYVFHADVPNELMHAAMVPMTLQPLVENSILHGFKGRRAGRVVLRAMEVNDRLRVMVEDDGRGISGDELEQLRAELARPSENSGTHLGLVQTAHRLRLAFEADVSVRLGRSALSGLVVEIEMPLQLLDDEAAARRAHA